MPDVALASLREGIPDVVGFVGVEWDGGASACEGPAPLRRGRVRRLSRRGAARAAQPRPGDVRTGECELLPGARATGAGPADVPSCPAPGAPPDSRHRSSAPSSGHSCLVVAERRTPGRRHVRTRWLRAADGPRAAPTTAGLPTPAGQPWVWAFTFPAAAVVTAALHWVALDAPPVRDLLSYLLIGALTALVAGVAIRTVLTLRRGELVTRTTTARADGAPEHAQAA